MSGLEARAPNPTLLLPDALQLHVVPIKRETARVDDMHGFQRDDDIVASEIDRARARIALTILPGELSRIPVHFACASRIRRGAVVVGKYHVRASGIQIVSLTGALCWAHSWLRR